MILVPVFLFYFVLVTFTLFAILAAAALFFAVALFWNLHRLSKMALAGVEEAREKISYVWTLFALVSGL